MAEGDVVVTHNKVNNNPDDPVTEAQGGVVNSDWNANHSLDGMSELLSSIRDLVIVDMGNDNYTMTVAEATAAAKVIISGGTGKTLTWPSTADAYTPGMQYVSGAFLSSDITLELESGGHTDTLPAGYNSICMVEPDTDIIVTITEDATYARTTATDVLKLGSQALKGTAVAGEIEYLTNTPYFTPTADNRAVLSAEHYVCNAAAKSLNDNTTAQSPFVSSTFTAAANTLYFFESIIYIKTGTTQHLLKFELDGTATVSDVHYFVDTRLGKAVGSGFSGWVDTTASTTVSNNSTSANRAVSLRGTIRITTGGTVIPKIGFSVAPGGTNTAAIGSYFKLSPAGSDTSTSVGNWS